MPRSLKVTELERDVQARFDASKRKVVPTDSKGPRTSERVENLVLPDGDRSRMPMTQEKYTIQEDPHLVQWEREVRKFLRKLSPDHAHRVSAKMVYEWATGIDIAELVKEGGSANRDLRHINKLLRFYFGDSYTTQIMGRKVPKAYKVKKGTYIKRRRPMTLVLYGEYLEKSLNP